MTCGGSTTAPLVIKMPLYKEGRRTACAAKALTGQLKTDVVGLERRLAEATNRITKLEQDVESKQRDLDAAKENYRLASMESEKRDRARLQRVADAESAAVDLRREVDAARAELQRDADAFGRKLEQCETELSTAKRQAFEARMQCDATVNTARQECRELCASFEERLVQQDLDKSAAEKQKRDFEQQAIDESQEAAGGTESTDRQGSTTGGRRRKDS